MKFKRIFSVLLALAMTAGMTACGPGTQGGGDKENEKKTDKGKTTLTMWSWSPVTRTSDKMIQAFEKENPDIHIDFTYYNYDPEYLSALAAASASGTLPDIVGLQPGALSAQYADYLTDYSSYAAKDWGKDWKSNYPDMIDRQIQMGNAPGDKGNYILPVEAQVISIVYNKNVFRKYHLDVPKTYDDLKKVCKTLNDNKIAPLFLGGANGWQLVNLFTMLCSQLDTAMLDKAQAGEIKWTDAKMAEATDNFKQMFDDGIFQTGAMSADANTNGTPAFVSNQAAMMALGSWWCQEYTADNPAAAVADWDFGFFYLPPVGSAKNAAAPVGGIDFGFGITKNCKNPDAAWKALKSFGSGAGIEACADDVNNLPAFKGIKPENKNLNKTLVKQYNQFSQDLDIAMNQRIGQPTVETALQNALAGVGSGQLAPKKALEDVQKAQDALQK